MKRIKPLKQPLIRSMEIYHCLKCHYEWIPKSRHDHEYPDCCANPRCRTRRWDSLRQARFTRENRAAIVRCPVCGPLYVKAGIVKKAVATPHDELVPYRLGRAGQPRDETSGEKRLPSGFQRIVSG